MSTNNPNLNYYLDPSKSVKDLIKLDKYPIDEGMQERHRLYSLLLMAITKYYWNGNKEGQYGTYPLNPEKYSFIKNDYVGHNIASIAVDAYGEVIDFEFNHNKTYNSSTEHAESRMVKRVFTLTQINDSWKVSLDKHNPRTDYNTFEDVVMYTTLESCSQCAGIMALARVKEIVYLQTDPGMYLIGNILRNLTKKIDNVEGSKGDLTSPMPISGENIEFTYFSKLNSSYLSFKQNSSNVAFFKPDPTPEIPLPKEKKTDSITSFLCTKYAYEVYSEAEKEFLEFTENSLSHPDYKPKDKAGVVIEKALTNKSVLIEVRDFYQYATKSGKRGTPHK